MDKSKTYIDTRTHKRFFIEVLTNHDEPFERFKNESARLIPYKRDLFSYTNFLEVV